MEQYARSWAADLGLSVSHFLGNGDNGEAFELSDGSVIKITHNWKEYALALAIVGIDDDHVVHVHGVKQFSDLYLGIWQEKLTIDEAQTERLFNELTRLCEILECSILDIEAEDLAEPLSPEALSMLEAIQLGHLAINQYGVEANDIHFSNIGIKDSGEFALFDQPAA